MAKHGNWKAKDRTSLFTEFLGKVVEFISKFVKVACSNMKR
jgi:hypothetical protein